MSKAPPEVLTQMRKKRLEFFTIMLTSALAGLAVAAMIDRLSFLY
jgi:hypothetical protein